MAADATPVRTYPSFKGRSRGDIKAVPLMEGECDLCSQIATTGFRMFGTPGAMRIVLCVDCGAKAHNQDPETWEKIREILNE
jgi:hypothetical protein